MGDKITVERGQLAVFSWTTLVIVVFFPQKTQKGMNALTENIKFI